MLLNTDAYVHPGWLEPMLDALHRPGVGAVVPQYRHPDGSLQEAGALLGTARCSSTGMGTIRSGCAIASAA